MKLVYFHSMLVVQLFLFVVMRGFFSRCYQVVNTISPYLLLREVSIIIRTLLINVVKYTDWFVMVLLIQFKWLIRFSRLCRIKLFTVTFLICKRYYFITFATFTYVHRANSFTTIASSFPNTHILISLFSSSDLGQGPNWGTSRVSIFTTGGNNLQWTSCFII